VHEILQHAAPRFGNAKVKEVPDKEHIDLRGTYEGAPIRFAVWLSFGTFWSIEMLCTSGLGNFAIERDLEKVPTVEDANDPFAKKETRRIFVAKGIFFQGDDADMAANLQRWDRMPEALQTRILREMSELDINSIRMNRDSVWIHQSPGFRDLPDGIGYMEACASLMAALKQVAPIEVRSPAPQPTRQPLPAEATHAPSVGREFPCGYCHSIYWMSPTRTHCPNCGAPPSA
jgi:hypothetical protein